MNSIFKRKFISTKAFYKTKFKQGKLKDPNQLPSSASDFYLIHRKALNIHYQNIYSAKEIFDSLPEDIKINNDLLVSDFTKDDLLLAKPGSSILKKLNNNTERSLALYLNKVVINNSLTTGIQETLTDAFVNYLFKKLNFDEYPLLMISQSDFNFKVFKKKITAKVKFSIEKNNTILYINENKYIHFLDGASEYGESQISAEILACAFINFNKVDSPIFKKNQTIYATRIIGTRFSFYKVFLSSDYYKSLYKGFPPNNLTVTIFRFPPNNHETTLFGYDYADKDQRRLILDLLYRLKEYLFKF
ncbi:hypothetical protein Glove_456g5 [Diversispora epigaea]|uniref:Uncharacterized protein n=1 Tax=Diversispora epigaea TaxID=1348612 RepID=A0A397GQN7_9GLOM|nr:hypothetical protein Glove_456g5 [Diversispora epigaea]